jgi:hypothetical protein
MTRDKLIDVLKKVEEYGYVFVNTKTENTNSPRTVASRFDDLDLVETKLEYETVIAELPPRQYFLSSHWMQIQRDKLELQPRCEGCGNKASKVFKKTWADKGFETMDSVLSICGKCKVVDGEVISFKDVKESIDKDHLKEVVKDMVDDIIINKAKQELRKIDITPWDEVPII